MSPKAVSTLRSSSASLGLQNDTLRKTAPYDFRYWLAGKRTLTVHDDLTES